MKDYLKEELTNEEKLIVFGIIWKVAKKYRKNHFSKRKINFRFIEDLDYAVEDTYDFCDYSPDFYREKLLPLSENQKCDIVMNLDALLREANCFWLIRTLTFNEKLVFFLFKLQKYNNREVSELLGTTEKTIYNRRNSVDIKLDIFKGGI